MSLLTGCSGGAIAEGDGRAFGDDLGDFKVAATLEKSNCGAGALGTPEDWEFRIRLSRQDPAFYWNTGAAAVEGRLGSDGQTFTLESETVVELGPEVTASLPCVIVRQDRAAGVLDDPGVDVTAFEGSLVYSFSETPDTDCTTLVGVPGGFAQLPCEIRYELQAEREKPPRK